MRSDRLYLADILDAIEPIVHFTAGIDEERFIADELIQSAVNSRRWYPPVAPHGLT
ncbi:MAG: hypothetical protein QMD17_02275 [Rhodocyclaceae bacterium]|jgi:uncharacterized protein with HEPN domain|nr:hypothetical protein [Rhodocyclaceae bacterium]